MKRLSDWLGITVSDRGNFDIVCQKTDQLADNHKNPC